MGCAEKLTAPYQRLYRLILHHPSFRFCSTALENKFLHLYLNKQNMGLLEVRKALCLDSFYMYTANTLAKYTL